MSTSHQPTCNISVVTGTPEAVDLQTAAGALQRRDAAVLAAVRDAACGSGIGGDAASRVAALQLAASQAEAQLAAALARGDAAACRAATLQHELEVRALRSMSRLLLDKFHESAPFAGVMHSFSSCTNVGWLSIADCTAPISAARSSRQPTPHI